MQTQTLTTTLEARLRLALEQAVRDAKAPGAVAYVGDLEHTFFFGATGMRQLVPKPLPAETGTIYDLASLTKVMATATAVLLLVEDGILSLDTPIGDILPVPEFKAFTLRHCLTHGAGLVAGLPYYRESSTIDAMLRRYAALPLKSPPGTRWLYSDVGYMILGRVVELSANETLDAFCGRRIFAPQGMVTTAFKPPKSWAARCAATEQSAWRRKIMLGEVHDENAYAVGGVAGHAGLFSTAEDVARYCRALLSGKILRAETLELMLRLGQFASWPWQGLGWQLDPWPTKNFGFLPSRSAFGHAGWTGTSLWIDRASGAFSVLLSNTCHPTRERRDNESLRRTFSVAVGSALYPRSTNTHTGLDRLVREDFAELRGKRIGLLTHHAAVDQLGRHVIDVIQLAGDIRIVRIFSPEHGLRGQAEAGDRVTGQTGSIPITSLYGERSSPSREELREIDVFVVDLQDVGARFYTYPATLKASMKACAEAGKPVLILDRPNPISGTILEGPIAVNTESLVCWGATPIRHGMTMGEIARWFANNDLKGLGLELRVCLLDSWQPERFWTECSLSWSAPSPNIPTPDAALAYAGMCLFEGCNLNEGRGTDTPFQLVGAPWLHARKIADVLPDFAMAGFEVGPVRYTPRSIPGKASRPRYLDEPCEGLRIDVRDPRAARPFALAVAMLCGIRREHPWRFDWERNFDLLAGSDGLRESIESGADAREIVESCTPQLNAYDAVRPKLYLPAPSSTPAV